MTICLGHFESVITQERLVAILLLSQTCPRLVPLSYPSRRGAADMTSKLYVRVLT